MQFDKAKNIKEVADSFSLAVALLEGLYKREDEEPLDKDKVSLSDVKEYFRCYEAFFILVPMVSIGKPSIRTSSYALARPIPNTSATCGTDNISGS